MACEDLTSCYDYEGAIHTNYTACLMANSTGCNNSTFNGTAYSGGVDSNLPFPGQPAGLDPLTLVLLMTYGTIATIGLLGNGLVIFVIIKYTKMKTVTNMYILNLSIADSLFLIGLPLIMTTFALKHWVFGFVLCKLYYILTCINMFTGTFTLTAMSGDRFIAVCYPIASMTLRTPKYASVAIALIWVFSFIFMLPVVLYTQIVPGVRWPDKYSCTIKWPMQLGTPGQNIFITYTLLLGFVIPVVLISLLYALLVIRLKTTGSHTQSVRRRNSHRKVTKLVTLIIAIFIICWLPYWVFQVFLISKSRNTPLQYWQVYIFHGFTLLSYSNSMINPLLYAFTNETFREAFISAFKCAKDPFRGPNRRISEWQSVNPTEPLKNSNKDNNHPNNHNHLKTQNGMMLTCSTADTQISKVSNGDTQDVQV